MTDKSDTPRERDCPHGSLLRSCEICDLREELTAARAEAEANRKEIENAAYERAAGVCDRLISGDGICAADGVWIHDCAAAIRALIKESK